MAKGTVVSVRLQEEELAALDAMGMETRADAIKALIGGKVRPAGGSSQAPNAREPSERQLSARRATADLPLGLVRPAPGSMLKRGKAKA